MLTFLITYGFQTLIVFGILYLLYEGFLADIINAKKKEKEERESKSETISKLAKVRLVSVNVKDIESFIEENAQYLSDTTVTALVSRIEELRNDRVIQDEVLKKQIEELK